MLELNRKVALISGGGSGLGLQFAKELLRHGLKGVTLADVNSELASKALQEIEDEFGPNKAIFVLTDVTDMGSYEAAFQSTIKVFKNLDIVINNAGILNDSIWEKEIAININGVVHGILLGLENYIPKYKSGSEGIIVNISSAAGLECLNMIPIYAGTKLAVLGMSRAFGDQAHYKRTSVKVLALCPGATKTPLLTEIRGRNLGPAYQQLVDLHLAETAAQKPEHVAKALVNVIKKASSGTVWVVKNDMEPYEFILPTHTTKRNI